MSRTDSLKKTVRFFAMLSLLSFESLHSQVDTTASSFFPAAIGDSWRYQYTVNSGFTTTITRDSVSAGLRYLFMDSSSVPEYELDSLLNVVSYPTTGYRRLQYRLKAQKGETWVVYALGPSMNMVARVEDVFWNYVLGTVTQIKRIGYYYQPTGDTLNFSSWQMDRYLAAGFGLYLEITDAMQTPSQELYGCIISGRQFGTMTAVERHLVTLAPKNFSLLPSFPNPFNPATTISFQLRERSYVALEVYDVLGRRVKTLVEKQLEVGDHRVLFRPENASSGIYIVRMIVGSQSQSNKMIYSK